MSLKLTKRTARFHASLALSLLLLAVVSAISPQQIRGASSPPASSQETIIATLDATNVESTSATLLNELLDMGFKNSVQMSFETGTSGNETAVSPTIETLEPSITSGSVTLKGKIDDMGSETSLEVYFEYGTLIDDAVTYGSRTTPEPRTGKDEFSALVVGLAPNTDFYFRAVGEGKAGTDKGDGKPFRIKLDWWKNRNNWLTGGISAFLALVVGFFLSYMYSQRNLRTDYGYSDNRYYEGELRNARQQMTTLRTELQTIKARNEFNASRLPRLKNEYFRLSAEVKKLGTTLSDMISRQLDVNPPEEEAAAYAERVRLLESIGNYITQERGASESLRREVLQLATDLSQENPKLSDTVEKVVSATNADGLNSLKPVLLQLKQQVEKREASPEIKLAISTLEKNIEGIRDYSYRLVPLKLLKFANELIQPPASEKENALREKTVQEIIKLINEYLKL
ncbi:MAG: hypothetical protein V1894_00770 [Chloroflexota bacterium]